MPIDDSMSALAALILIGLVASPLLIKERAERKYQAHLDQKLYKMCHPYSKMGRR